ncbi:MAG: UDP-glucose 4-epimerase GalE [Clostridia bacterium]|nr:UDP-glucose 4-epimerase GalE [Clostridia bacterium]
MMVLITGIAGYIGSHTAYALSQAGFDFVGMDNFVNSRRENINVLKELTGKDFKFYEVDMLDEEGMEKIFAENHIDSVIHFAGLKAVGESVEKPVLYYHNNITGTLILLEKMKKYGCKKIVFSSSATVYGNPETVPVNEDMPTSTTNPYGSTKLMIENILRDVCVADKDFCAVLLRYFNPIGAHKCKKIGENPNGIPNNLMPRLCQAALGITESLTVFGTDYPTPDGTGVRDYIHVCDLADGHTAALKKAMVSTGALTYNLGTGNGYSVFDLINTFSRVNGVEIPYKICPRRPGDVPAVYACPDKAYNELGWKAKFGLEDMCIDSWEFIKEATKK